MLGLRLNRLGAALSRGSLTSRLFRAGSYGLSATASNYALNKQTFSSPASSVTAVGDPVGLIIPQNSKPASIVNWLIQTDDISNTAWTKTATVTGNYALNDAGVPKAALANATVAGQTVSRTVTVASGDIDQRCYYAELYAGTATESLLQMTFQTGGTSNVASAKIVWSNQAVSVVTQTASSVAAGIEAGATAGWYRVYVTGANSGGANTEIKVEVLPANSGTGTVIIGRQGLVKGSLPGSHQANEFCLGGSGERAGGTNLTTWSRDFDNAAWTKGSSTVTAENVWTASAATAVHSITNAATPTVNGLVYTTSVELTPTYRYYQLYANGSATPGFVNYDTQTDTVSASTATGSCTDLGSGRKRLTITYTADAASRYPILAMVTGLAAVRAESWLAAGTESATLHYVWTVLGSSTGTYSRNMDSIGGLLKALVPYQDVSGDRVTLARRPKRGIVNLLSYSVPDTTNASWSVSNCTNAGNGVFTVSGTGSTSHPVFVTSYTVANATQYTWSAIVARRDFQYMGIALNSSTYFGNAAVTYFDLDEERVITNAAEAATIENLGGGLYRISTTDTSISAGTTSGVRVYPAISTTAGVTATVSFDAATYPGDFEVRDTQLEISAVTTTQQTVLAAWDVSEEGASNAYCLWSDGVSDCGLTGMQSFGTASLMAKASQTWSIGGAARTASTVSTQTILAKCSSNLSNRTLNIAINDGTTLSIRCRGTATNTATITVGDPFVWLLVWDGSALTFWLNNTSYNITVGTASEEAQNILFGCRTSSSKASFFDGFNDVTLMIDRALSTTENSQWRSFMDSTYRSV